MSQPDPEPKPQSERTPSSESEPTPPSEPKPQPDPTPPSELEPELKPPSTSNPVATPVYPQAIHLRPTAPLAERVLLPGDPGRALALAQTLLEKPLMFNHHRGLWGYTGPARTDGEPLTIQSTGMGGPSAAIVLTELISLGARRAIRVGTCGALQPGLELGELVIARESICLDGASRALVPGDRMLADQSLTEALILAAPTAHAGPIVSVDLFYDPNPPSGAPGAIAVEMEAATLFAVGAAASVPVGCVLVVSDTFDAVGARTHIDEKPLLEAAEAMGAAAVAALPA
jgi:uridine phosphorylase